MIDHGTYIEVQSGDTLWSIAEKHAGGGSNYKKLATINNIPDPYWVYPGQKVYLSASDVPGSSGGSGGSSGGSSGSSSSSTSTTSSANKPKILQFGPLSTDPTTFFATWTWSREKDTESYKVVWTYDCGDGVWLVGASQNISVDKDDSALSRQYSFQPPANAKVVRFKVKPISKTKEGASTAKSGIIYTNGTSSSTSTTYFDASWSDEREWTVTLLSTPATPTITINKYKVEAALENVNVSGATHIEFELIKDNKSTGKQTKKAIIAYDHASVEFDVVPGSEYKVRCRALGSGRSSSGWSDYSSSVNTIPATPSNDIKLKATSETSIYIEWPAANGATKYDIEYATKKTYFDGTDLTTTKAGIEFTHFELTGLESGYEYFFRVRAANDKGESGWSAIKSVIIGTKPAPPTTWSSTTTAIVEEELNLYWIHNTQDGSSQTTAELELIVDGVKQDIITVENTRSEDEKDKTSVYPIDTSAYVEGTKLEWRVRTKGITAEYSDWSTQRVVDIYAPPTLELSVTDKDDNEVSTLTSLPFYISAIAGPTTQTPVGYQLSITSNDIYETTDNLGNDLIVNVGDKVYSKYFDTKNDLLVEMSAHNVNLDNNITYTITCSVTMDSGLTAEAAKEVLVNWSDVSYILDAEIGINPDTLTAYIRPYCSDFSTNNYLVTVVGGEYVTGNEALGWISGTPLPGAKTTTGEPVYTGVTVDGDEVYFCSKTVSTPIEDVYLSIYRREFDGKFTPLAEDMDGAKYTTVTDPHPALDFARYRIVAKTKTTGAISYYDAPGYPVGGTSVVLQWDEEWTNFETTEEASLANPPWTGSMLMLPYNIDVSDSHKPDVALINYIGRENPTAYYGTQVGHSATWNVEIEATDKETLYALRRLATWMGNVYVREPSGSGYWANVVVSFNQKHCGLTIPVSFNITRVEGGA